MKWTKSEVLRLSKLIKSKPLIKCEDCGKNPATYVNKGRMLCKQCEYIAIQPDRDKAE